jgi:hypothetical protein
MSCNDQQNLFTKEAQSDLFGADVAPTYRPDPEKVRTRVRRILSEARSAQAMPWEPGRLSLYRTIFPQLTLWLPEEEGAQLCLEFETELTRLQAA